MHKQLDPNNIIHKQTQDDQVDPMYLLHCN